MVSRDDGGPCPWRAEAPAPRRYSRTGGVPPRAPARRPHDAGISSKKPEKFFPLCPRDLRPEIARFPRGREFDSANLKHSISRGTARGAGRRPGRVAGRARQRRRQAAKTCHELPRAATAGARRRCAGIASGRRPRCRWRAGGPPVGAPGRGAEAPRRPPPYRLSISAGHHPPGGFTLRWSPAGAAVGALPLETPDGSFTGQSRRAPGPIGSLLVHGDRCPEQASSRILRSRFGQGLGEGQGARRPLASRTAHANGRAWLP